MFKNMITTDPYGKIYVFGDPDTGDVWMKITYPDDDPNNEPNRRYDGIAISMTPQIASDLIAQLTRAIKEAQGK